MSIPDLGLKLPPGVDVSDFDLRRNDLIESSIPEIQQKLWRVYYNCREHFPHLVAVDNGTIQSQIRVQAVTFVNCGYLFGNTDMGKPQSQSFEIAQRKGKQNEPTWWIELAAYAVFENGSVVFHGSSS